MQSLTRFQCHFFLQKEKKNLKFLWNHKKRKNQEASQFLTSCYTIKPVIKPICSTSLNIRKMQIKTTVRYYLTAVRMAIIKRKTSVAEDVDRREPSALLVGMEVVCKMESKMGMEKPLWTTGRFFKKYKIELPYDPAILFLDMYL